MVDTQQSTSPPGLPESSSRLRLEYLDGLRGLAALLVVYTHIYYQSGWRESAPGWKTIALEVVQLLNQGRASVAIFIVLSGYCLMLPVTRSHDRRLKGGTWSYLKRRARRILPPYYAALAVISLFILLVPVLQTPLNVDWNEALPALTPAALLSHLFMVQNLNKEWFWKIDPPMWSVATEWQIYFLFPGLLLPVWRRFGNWATVLTAFITGFALCILLHSTRAAPWFIGLFALGMVAAIYNFSPKQEKPAWVDSLPWGSLSAILFTIFIFIMALPTVPIFHLAIKGSDNWLLHFQWAIDGLVGITTASLLIFCTRSIASLHVNKLPWIVHIFGSRLLVGIGGFSYSLYLIHDPIIAMLFAFFHQEGLSGAKLFAVMLLVALPLAVVAALIFHYAFERRFLSQTAKPT